MTGTLHEDRCTFLIISSSIVLINVLDKSFRKNQNTYFIFNKTFFENSAVYKTMWKKYCRAGQATDDNMAHVHCILDN